MCHRATTSSDLAATGSREVRHGSRRVSSASFRDMSEIDGRFATSMRLIVARCSAHYEGRGTTHLPEAVRLLMVKSDGTFMIWADSGGQSVKPLNWMTPPTVIEETGDPLDRIVVRKRAGKADERLSIRIVSILMDVA